MTQVSTHARQDHRLAERTVTAVVAGMIAAAAAATVVGFWLSYSGLHAFAAGAGLRSAEGWAWPASVDLFIAAGEAGVTISALRRQRDKGAWAYLALGFAASVTGNVLHPAAAHLAWSRYAVAAVPPVAAMLALAALLRHVYRIALEHYERTVPDAPETVSGDGAEPLPETRLESAPGSAPSALPAASVSVPEPVPQAPSAAVREPSRKRVPKPSPSAAKRMSGADLAPYVGTLLERDPGVSAAAVARDLRVGHPKAREALRLAKRERLTLTG